MLAQGMHSLAVESAVGDFLVMKFGAHYVQLWKATDHQLQVEVGPQLGQPEQTASHAEVLERLGFDPPNGAVGPNYHRGIGIHPFTDYLPMAQLALQALAASDDVAWDAKWAIALNTEQRSWLSRIGRAQTTRRPARDPSGSGEFVLSGSGQSRSTVLRPGAAGVETDPNVFPGATPGL